jgi:hypothetical protein
LIQIRSKDWFTARLVVLCVAETKVWTADKQPVWLFSQKKWLRSASNSAARDKGHTGALYSKNSDRAAEASWDATFYYGVRSLRRCTAARVLRSDELQGFITHEMVLSYKLQERQWDRNQVLGARVCIRSS